VRLRTVDAFTALSARQHFNLTSFTGLALCYVVITIPMSQFTDRLLPAFRS